MATINSSEDVQSNPFEILPWQQDTVARFDFDDDLNRLIERHRVRDIMNDFHDGRPLEKVQLPMIPDGLFSMHVQNIVTRTGLRRPLRISERMFLEQQGVEVGEDETRPYHISLKQCAFAQRYMGIQYNHKRFASIICRDMPLGSASLHFGTGRKVGTGTAQPEVALYQAQMDVEKTRQSGYDEFLPPNIQIYNIVSSGSLPFQVCTNLLAWRYSALCKKVPVFPGTVVRFNGRPYNRVILVFDSGNLCHSGSKSILDIYEDIAEALPWLYSCRVSDANLLADTKAAKLLGTSTHTST